MIIKAVITSNIITFCIYSSHVLLKLYTTIFDSVIRIKISEYMFVNYFITQKYLLTYYFSPMPYKIGGKMKYEFIIFVKNIKNNHFLKTC